MLPNFNDFADTDIHLSNIWHNRGSSWLWLLHLLLLLLLWLLLLLCCGTIFGLFSGSLCCLLWLLLILLLLLLLASLFPSSSLITSGTTCLFGLGCLFLGELLELGLRHASCVVSDHREACENALPVDLLKHAR